RGLPFHDCSFEYDMVTGKRLSAERKSEIAAAAASIDTVIAKERAASGLKRNCGDAEKSEVANCSRGVREMTYAGGREATQPYLALIGANLEIPDSVSKAGVTLIDFSPALPLGYGYQLLTEGGA